MVEFDPSKKIEHSFEYKQKGSADTSKNTDYLIFSGNDEKEPHITLDSDIPPVSGYSIEHPEGEAHPMYAVPITPGSPFDPNPPKFKQPSIPYPTKPPTIEVTPAPEQTNKPKLRATAKDYELLKLRNASFETNDKEAKGQFVLGDEEGEVSTIGGTQEQPDIISITDNTNNQNNTYIYRKLSPEEIEAGVTSDGQKLSKGQFEKGKTYYILVSAANEKGESIRSNNNVEVYELNYSYDKESNTCNYDLVQTAGMDGSGKSSIDYNKRNR